MYASFLRLRVFPIRSTYDMLDSARKLEGFMSIIIGDLGFPLVLSPLIVLSYHGVIEIPWVYL